MTGSFEMRRTMMAVLAPVLVLMCSLAVTDGALAQRRSTPRDEADDKLPPSVPPPVSTLPPTRGISGPKLQPGAVVCRTELDLERRGEVNRRRIDNVPDPGNPLENCRMMTQERGVEVVEKHGLGRTEVKLKPTGEVGWTDTFLR